MKKIDLGQMVSILANIGVLAGIVFLGFELQQNNDQLQAQSRANLYDMQTAIQSAIFGNTGGLTDIVSKARQGDALTPNEAFQLGAFRTYVVRTMEFMFLEDPEHVRGSSGWMDAVFRGVPGVREFYDGTKAGRDAEFVRFVDQEVLPRLDQ